MVEYQPLSLPETVRVKLNHWFSPDPEDLPQAQILNKHWDLILFQLILDVGCSKGGQRWRSDAKAVVGAYEVKVGGSAASETYTLFEVKNGTAREVPLSETELRHQILSVLSKELAL